VGSHSFKAPQQPEKGDPGTQLPDEAGTGEALASNKTWVVMFTDGVDCAPCKIANTNLKRLAASLVSLPVQVGIVNCEEPKNKDFCYDTHSIPASPHRPVLKLWKAGPKRADDLGEVLYNVNEIEPHYAMRILEKTLRLALADRAEESDKSVMLGATSTFEEEKEEEEEKPPADAQQFHPGQFSSEELMWNGPAGSQAAPQAWNVYDQGIQNRLT